MNLRQKNKKLKQELEWYKKQMIPTREIRFDSRQMRVETLAVQRSVSQASCIPVGYIYNELTRELMIDVRKYIIYDNYKKLTHPIFPDEYIFTAEVKVVVPDGGDEF